jgi:hypothetical protein
MSDQVKAKSKTKTSPTSEITQVNKELEKIELNDEQLESIVGGDDDFDLPTPPLDPNPL